VRRSSYGRWALFRREPSPPWQEITGCTQLDHWYGVHSRTRGPSAAPALEAPSLLLQTLQPTKDVGTDS
jgi:hypothetical protein